MLILEVMFDKFKRQSQYFSNSLPCDDNEDNNDNITITLTTRTEVVAVVAVVIISNIFTIASNKKNLTCE
jgi:hypothetical protein